MGLKRSIKNYLLCSGVVMAGVAAFSAISYTVTRNLMKVALNRENPKNIQREKERLSGSKKFADIFCHIKAAAEKLEDSMIYPQYFGSDHCPVAIITK